MPTYGLAVPLGLAFADGIAHGALAAAAEIPGVILRILRDPPSAAALAAWAPWAAPDGLIAFATSAPGCRRLVGVCTDDGPGVGVDEAAIGRIAAEHLVAQVPASLAVIDNGAGWSTARARAFAAAADRPVAVLREIAWESPAGRRRLIAQLIKLPRPVGCFAGNDRVGAAIAEAASAAGVVVGRDLLLIGADDDALSCRSVHPALSSVQIPWERVGREALLMLHRHGAGRVVVPPLTVAVRGSSDVLACHDPALSAAVAAARAGAAGVDDLARAAGLQRRNLERRCQTVLGLSPLALLHRARLDRARTLLATGATVEATAQACGWTTRLAFSAAFRRATGETPGAWAKQRR